MLLNTINKAHNFINLLFVLLIYGKSVLDCFFFIKIGSCANYPYRMYRLRTLALMSSSSLLSFYIHSHFLQMNDNNKKQ